jgi:hypothetical protein
MLPFRQALRTQTPQGGRLSFSARLVQCRLGNPTVPSRIIVDDHTYTENSGSHHTSYLVGATRGCRCLRDSPGVTDIDEQSGDD